MKDKGRLPPFVPLLKETLDSPAWRATSHGAKALYVALKCRHNGKFNNNGRIYLSQRKAAQEINSHTNQIKRWFRELQFYGFIVMTIPGGLGVHGKGKAPHWRLTEIGDMKDQRPTRDFLYWNGVRFSKHQPEFQKPNSKACPRKAGHTVLEKTDAGVLEKQDTEWNKCPRKAGHRAPPGVLEKQDVSILTTGWRVGGDLPKEAPPPNLTLMTVLEGGKTGSRTAGSSQVCAQCGGRNDGAIFRYKNGSRPIWLHRFCRRYWEQTHGAAS